MKVTKKHIRSLLKSEDCRANSDDVEFCLEGWQDAASAPDEERKIELPRRINAWERIGDLYSLGYLTYIYGYTDVRLHGMDQKVPKQLKMELAQ